MSRSGYSDDCDGWALIRWRGAVKKAIHGKRGQAFLREMLEALDALPEKMLVGEDLQNEHGGVCAIGSVGKKRGVDMARLSVDVPEQIADAFGISSAMVQEIEFINDDEELYGGTDNSPEGQRKRFIRVRGWVVQQIGEQVTA